MKIASLLDLRLCTNLPMIASSPQVVCLNLLLLSTTLSELARASSWSQKGQWLLQGAKGRLLIESG